MTSPYHVHFERLQQQLQKLLVGEEGGLVELLLPEVKVVVHWLHEGTEEVHTGMADAVVLPLQSPHRLLPNDLSETGMGGVDEVREGGKKGGMEGRREGWREGGKGTGVEGGLAAGREEGTHLGREVKASKPALEATSLLRAWNWASSWSLGRVLWSPSFISRAVRAPLISFSLFSAKIPCEGVRGEG